LLNVHRQDIPPALITERMFPLACATSSTLKLENEPLGVNMACPFDGSVDCGTFQNGTGGEG
jgi:hypothetical protein